MSPAIAGPHRYAVIFAGGRGSRLWPLSTDTSPKQFQGLGESLSLIGQTFQRLASCVGTENIFISTTRQYAGGALEAIPGLDPGNLILEPNPQGKPAAYHLTAAAIARRDPQAVVLTAATDSSVTPLSAFQEAADRAFRTVEEYRDRILLLGVKPTELDTSLGYIGVEESDLEVPGLFEAKDFIEKPDKATLEKLAATRTLYSNTSHYCFAATTLLSVYQRAAPDFFAKIDRYVHDMREIASYDGAGGPKHELDAFIANGSPIGVIDGGFGWHDIGTWPSVYRMLAETTGHDRVFLGPGTDEGSRDTLVVNGSTMDIMTAGLTGLAVVASDDTVLVVPLELLERSPEVLARLRRSADAPKRK